MKKIIIPVLLIALLTAACVSDDVKGARDGDLQAVKDYIQSGGDVNERKSRGMTLLMYASAGGHVHIIDYLMSVGADIRIKDDRGYTAFLHGASAGRSNSMDSLLSYGAGLNDRDNGGRTALILAAYQDSYNTAVFLLDRGADSGTANSSGYTALLASLDKSASQSSGFQPGLFPASGAGRGIFIGRRPDRRHRLQSRPFRQRGMCSPCSLIGDWTGISAVPGAKLSSMGPRPGPLFWTP